MYYFMNSVLKFTVLVSLNAEGTGVDRIFPILNILSRSGNIRDQIRKLCKIAPNFACLCPRIFYGTAPLIFGLAL